MMRKWSWIAAIGLLITACSVSLAGEARPATAGASISIDETAWKQWGFQYPVTYVFGFSGNPDGLQVRRRDGGSGAWSPLAEKTSAEFFNGVECVRLDRQQKKLFVSVGFQKTHTIQLDIAGVAEVRFEGVAKYYDDRRATYTLSLDNWGCNPWGHPGAPWRGLTDDASDNYQAALHVCRGFHLPVSIAINSRSAGDDACWRLMQEELDLRDASWEPAVHGQTHPKNAEAYAIRGYQAEILGCRDDILQHLRNIPYGPHIYEHILTHGYVDDAILKMDGSVFLFLRGFNWLDNPASNDYVRWNPKYGLYGVGGLNTKGYDSMLERRTPKGRYYAADVAELNEAFDRVHAGGGIFYGLWHPDRFQNSILYDPGPGEDGVRGSTLMPHLAHVANHKDVWYVANGWLYSYRFVAERASVSAPPPGGPAAK